MMKTILVAALKGLAIGLLGLAILSVLAGCTTNGVYDGKKTLLFVGGVVVTGYVASHGSDKKKEVCAWQPISNTDWDMIYICK